MGIITGGGERIDGDDSKGWGLIHREGYNQWNQVHGLSIVLLLRWLIAPDHQVIWTVTNNKVTHIPK